MAKPAKLNLVALMDIFTILVLFLMVNNGDVEVLDADKAIVLPESVSEKRPDTTLLIKVTSTDVFLNDRGVATIESALAQVGSTLSDLELALQLEATNSPSMSNDELETGRPIVIMADQKMPYELLKRIMATCAATDYRDISLAVSSNPPAPGDAAEALSTPMELQTSSLGDG